MHLLDIIAQLPYFQNEKHTRLLPHLHIHIAAWPLPLDLPIAPAWPGDDDLSSPTSWPVFTALAHICSCRWDVLAAVRSNPKGRDSMKKLCTTTRARHCSLSVPVPSSSAPRPSFCWIPDSYKSCCKIPTGFSIGFFLWGSHRLLMGSYRIPAQFL